MLHAGARAVAAQCAGADGYGGAGGAGGGTFVQRQVARQRLAGCERARAWTLPSLLAFVGGTLACAAFAAASFAGSAQPCVSLCTSLTWSGWKNVKCLRPCSCASVQLEASGGQVQLETRSTPVAFAARWWRGRADAEAAAEARG